MKNITVLGIGNRLMMDDGIGINVVERLSQQNSIKNCEFLIGETDIDYCLSVIDKANYIVIIDAVINGRNPGDITILPVKSSRGLSEGISLHNLHLVDYIKNFKKNLKGIVIGIEPFEITCHFGLSLIIDQKLSVICENIKNTLKQHLLGVGKENIL